MKHLMLKAGLYPFCAVFLSHIKGTENIPKKTPFVIIANHEKRNDPHFIFYVMLKNLDKKVHFISTPAYLFLGNMIIRQWAACIPLFSPMQAYDEAKKLIESGEIVGIFPEGRLYKKVRPLKTGAVRLALETNVPILPIGLKSSWTPFSSKLNIGKPVYLKDGIDIEKKIEDLIKCVYKLRNDME